MSTQSVQQPQQVVGAIQLPTMQLPLNVFMSYAHEDEAHRETLARHLRALEDEGLIRLWHDRKITAGREWAGAIDEALADSQIVLLLISADFLASEYCNDKELTEAIRLHDARRARVIPVILRSCDWEHSRFARFNALPPDGKTIAEARHPDQRFKAVAKGLRDAISDMTSTSPAGVSAAQSGAPVLPSKASPASRQKHKLSIKELSVFGIKFGPIELPLPQIRGTRLTLGVLLVLLTAGWGVRALFVAPALRESARAMRISHYERALEQLKGVPERLAGWFEVSAAREKAQLGMSLYNAPQDWETIGLELKRQLKRHPSDATLLMIKAQYLLRHDEDYDQARSLAEAALKSDPEHAEAWFLLGLDLDMKGDLEGAIRHYRKAVEFAPDSPPYRNNLAHALLELGRYDEALSEYVHISQFPLARVEQALALWALGRPKEAAEAQQQALAMLDKTELMNSLFNRRRWMFTLSDRVVRLPVIDEKRCYARLGEAASRRLAGGNLGEFPPPDCKASHLGALVADDLCRYIDAVQPSLAPTARELRQMLGHPGACPAPNTPGPSSTT